MIKKYENCKIINIVWIERGILITIIYYILKKYIILLNKIIIINNKEYCKFLKIIFPELKFSIFKKHIDDNFYFNIRKIIKNQDIIIDYLANYYKVINTKKIKLLPWYDMNDPIIAYQYNSKFKIKIKKYKSFINKFSQCKRANYYNKTWDAFIEYTVLKKYIKFNKKLSIHEFLNIINNFLKSTYTNTVEKSKIYYIDRKILYPLPYNLNQQINPNISFNIDKTQKPDQIQINEITIGSPKTVPTEIVPTRTDTIEIVPPKNVPTRKNLTEIVPPKTVTHRTVTEETEILTDLPFEPVNIDKYNFVSDIKCEDSRDLKQERELYISILGRKLKFKLEKYDINIKEYIRKKIEVIDEYLHLLESINKYGDLKIKNRIERNMFEHKTMKEIYDNLMNGQELSQLIKYY